MKIELDLMGYKWLMAYAAWAVAMMGGREIALEFADWAAVQFANDIARRRKKYPNETREETFAVVPIKMPSKLPRSRIKRKLYFDCWKNIIDDYAACKRLVEKLRGKKTKTAYRVQAFVDNFPGFPKERAEHYFGNKIKPSDIVADFLAWKYGTLKEDESSFDPGTMKKYLEQAGMHVMIELLEKSELPKPTT